MYIAISFLCVIKSTSKY